MKLIILTAFLMAITLGIRGQSNATQIEYFLDADNGFGLNTVLDLTSPDIDITETILANIPSTTEAGYHKLYMRVKDAGGNWSQTFRKHIEIVKPFIERNVVVGEYFIDDDPEMGTAVSFEIDSNEEDIEQAFTAQIQETATIGYHKLYGRVKDIYGNWSHTFRKNIEVYKNPITNLVEIEYFFESDSEFGNNVIVSIDEPENDGTWTFNVPYAAGDYNFEDALFVRLKDSNGNWSITTILDEIATLGIDEHLLASTSIYPNPFSETINILSNHSSLINYVSIYNIFGRMVYKSISNLDQLNLSFLSPGVYILRLSADTETAAFKIIKN